MYVLALAVVITACVSSCKTADEGNKKPAMSDANLPMNVTYRGEPEIGSSENTVKVMNWNKWLSTGKLDSAFALLADSVTVRLSDGDVFDAPADSIKNVIRGYFGSISAVNMQYVAVLPLDVKISEGKTDQWVLSWTDETYMMKNGTRDHNVIHEDYRLVNGKIREINQYARKVPEVTTSNK